MSGLRHVPECVRCVLEREDSHRERPQGAGRKSRQQLAQHRLDPRAIDFAQVDDEYDQAARKATKTATISCESIARYGHAELLAKQILDQLTTQLNQRGITVENVLLRDIQLPSTLKSSIESKQQAEQEALAMNFRLQKETQEAQRKRIEAQGIRDFQQIVAQGISPQLLEWKGIEATELLAKSSNSKVVVIGNNKNGLPLILGQ